MWPGRVSPRRDFQTSSPDHRLRSARP